jgi:hypothetical protein
VAAGGNDDDDDDDDEDGDDDDEDGDDGADLPYVFRRVIYAGAIWLFGKKSSRATYFLQSSRRRK